MWEAGFGESENFMLDVRFEVPIIYRGGGVTEAGGTPRPRDHFQSGNKIDLTPN